MSFLEGKLNSIAEAAASGFLKVPEIKEPVNLEQTSKQTGAGMSIADAAKTGLLKVPTAGEKKGQRPASYWLTDYVINVNLNKLNFFENHQIKSKTNCNWLTHVYLHFSSATLERFSFECRKVISFAFTTLRDWLKRFAPLFHPIRSETKTNCVIACRALRQLRVITYRALRQLHVITSSFDWFTVCLCSLWLVLVLRHSNENRSITVFVDTRPSKTKHPWKRFQNFRQSHMLWKDRIEIHQSQPASTT